MCDKKFKALMEEFNNNMDALLKETLDVLGTDSTKKLTEEEADKAMCAAKGMSDGIVRAAFESAVERTAKLLGLDKDKSLTSGNGTFKVEETEDEIGDGVEEEPEQTTKVNDQYDEEAALGVIIGIPEKFTYKGEEVIKLTTQHGDCFLPKDLFEFNFRTINNADGVSEEDAEDLYQDSEVAMSSIGSEALAGIVKLPNESVLTSMVGFEQSDEDISLDDYKEIVEENLKKQILDRLDFVHNWALFGM